MEISKLKKKELEVLAQQAAKSIKSERDLCDFSAMLKKITVEAALKAELNEHIGYKRHQSSNNTNSHNGYSSKTLPTDDGRYDVDVPRDRDGSFEPQLVRKRQTRLNAMDDKIHCLYAKGMTTRKIVLTF
jgi:transposase-like protein